MRTGSYDAVREFVDTLEIIDTHEHLPHREDARNLDTDVLIEYIHPYFGQDLISSGMPRADLDRVMDAGLPLVERFALVEPYWNACRYTGYGRQLDLCARELYGLPRIDRNTIEPLNEAFLSTLAPGAYRRIMRQKAKIRIGILDSNLDCDQEFFVSVFRLDEFIFPRTAEQMLQIEREAGFRICCLDDWLAACEQRVERAVARGAVAIKHGLAYERSLLYERTSKKDAEEEFDRLFSQRHLRSQDRQVGCFGKAGQDYMMHFALRLASRRELVYQFHTGLQAGNGNRVRNCDPTLLSNLFLEYPGVTFDLFHIGYPYYQQTTALGKMFANVYLDMCWAHTISPEASRAALSEWLDALPCNKISAFGGDSFFVDGVYSHALMMRDNVSRVLAEKLDNGDLDLDDCKYIAKSLLYGNPERLFRLTGRL
jgi:predicted TIM-barrel fold metal-dependent hydrolase